MTEALIIVNLLIYLIGLAGHYWDVVDLNALLDFGHLGRLDFKPHQLLTYQFLHDPTSIWHIAFNMLFLWVFGSAVEDRLGHFGFLAFYLAGGAISGLTHMAFDPSPVIGASGAVAAVSGAFLAFFPRSRIQVLIFFFMVGVISIPAAWFILFYIAVDVLRHATSLLGAGDDTVAYLAHIAGYLYGFGVGFILLATKILPREEFDVFFLFKQWRRRAALRAANRHSGGGLWESASADTGQRLEKANRKRELAPHDQRHAEIRAQISAALANHDLGSAAAIYRRLLREDPSAVLPESRQVDLASQLFAEGDFTNAAAAYELLLDRYPRTAKREEVQFLLALMYTRHLQKHARAQELLDKLSVSMTDDSHRALAAQLRDELDLSAASRSVRS
jgi:membrane associated rhomboid family serine protease